MVAEEVSSIQDERKRACGFRDRGAFVSWQRLICLGVCTGFLELWVDQSFLTQLSQVLTTQLGNSFRLEICIRMDP